MATISVPPGRTLRDLRHLTPARVGLGRAGASMPTGALLEFTLDHARARDAVHAGFDVSALMLGLSNLGLEAVEVRSRVRDRNDEAPSRIAWLVRAGLARGMTGVTLKDESGDHISGQVAVAGLSRHDESEI